MERENDQYRSFPLVDRPSRRRQLGRRNRSMTTRPFVDHTQSAHLWNRCPSRIDKETAPVAATAENGRSHHASKHLAPCCGSCDARTATVPWNGRFCSECQRSRCPLRLSDLSLPLNPQADALASRCLSLRDDGYVHSASSPTSGALGHAATRRNDGVLRDRSRIQQLVRRLCDFSRILQQLNGFGPWTVIASTRNLAVIISEVSTNWTNGGSKNLIPTKTLAISRFVVIWLHEIFYSLRNRLTSYSRKMNRKQNELGVQLTQWTKQWRQNSIHKPATLARKKIPRWQQRMRSQCD
jgi:hypothetical protein